MKGLLLVLVLSLIILVKECSSFQVYVRKIIIWLKHPIATEEDRLNPNYTDPCFSELGSICTYCCILSKGECSRDIRACEPMLVDDRKFYLFYLLIGTMIGVLCGCPLAAKIF